MTSSNLHPVTSSNLHPVTSSSPRHLLKGLQGSPKETQEKRAREAENVK
ncbi:MAG: hypothetical protein GY822_05035 [Deltaproteobacteria bacterium]|nr:hypothetical protein [Deltaproteobacteria bacterium]